MTPHPAPCYKANMSQNLVSSPSIAPNLDSMEETRKFLGALGVHAMEMLHGRLIGDPGSSNKLLLEFADTAMKAADIYPKANAALLGPGTGATINFHFSKPPPGHSESVVTYDHEPTATATATAAAAATATTTFTLPAPSAEMQAASAILNMDLYGDA